MGDRDRGIVRQRKPPVKQKTANGTKSKQRDRPFGWTSLCLIAGVLSFVGYTGFQLYSNMFGSRLAPKMKEIVGVTADTTTWGTYRAHTYFGLRQKTPKSDLFGIMWYEQPEQQSMPRVRHWCDQGIVDCLQEGAALGDGLSRYSWTQADGKTFGRQNITEPTAQIRVDWLNQDDAWTARIHINPLKDKRFNFVFYMASQSDNRFQLNRSMISSPRSKVTILQVDGRSERTGLVWNDEKLDLTHLNDILIGNTGVNQINNKVVYVLYPQKIFEEGNFVALQFHVVSKASFEISLSTQTTTPPQGDEFVNELAIRSEKFQKDFQNIFHINGKGYTQVALDMAKVALSNMLGSIGYWYGSNKVLDNGKIVPYGPHELISAVPSRPFFPRGFLWDEGFHNLLIQRFDPDLSVEILTSWLNAMNEDGWIPREMILGVEAEAKVPAEYVTQYPNNANPPSMFLLVENLMENEKIVEKYSSVFKQVYLRLERWYNYLMKSQKGKTAGTMRWRGRNSTTDLELNPKTLASGLDDYPRASHPSAEEYHLDLRCWMALCSRVMSKLSILYGDEASKKKYAAQAAQFSNYKQLKDQHWSPREKAFFDYGLHSLRVELVKEVDKKNPGQFVIKRRSILEPLMRVVDDTFGYNSLFPLIFHLIPPDAVELGDLLNKLKDPEELWTEFGLRSLSLRSRYYAARNTEHDPPYWRGYIWINLNYLILSSLHYYSTQDGPYKELSHQLFIDLRGNLVRNMAIQFNRTGYLYENYDDRTGQGRGTHPFTGWSSLILLIMDGDLAK